MSNLASIANEFLRLFFVRGDAFGLQTQDGAITDKGIVTPELIARHLSGESRIGAHTTNTKNLCLWGAIDIDHDKEELTDDERESLQQLGPRLVEIGEVLGLPLVLEISKSGAWHVFLFSASLVSASCLRRVLRLLLKEASLPIGDVKQGGPHNAVEIFPGQNEIGDGYGNWVYLPYFNLAEHGRSAVVALSADRSNWIPIPVERFLAEVKKVDPQKLTELSSLLNEDSRISGHKTPHKSSLFSAEQVLGRLSSKCWRFRNDFKTQSEGVLDEPTWFNWCHTLAVGSGMGEAYRFSSLSSKHDGRSEHRLDIIGRNLRQDSAAGPVLCSTFGCSGAQIQACFGSVSKRDGIITNTPIMHLRRVSGSSPWQPVLTDFSDIQERSVDWLWYPYLPLGRLTILEGDPGQGKSWFSLALAASLSLGSWPFYINGSESLSSPSSTIYVSSEDDPADTIKKRLRILGADQSRIKFLHGKARLGGSDVVTITLDDIPILAESIKQTSAKLVVIDPVQAYLPPRVDMNRAENVRSVLTALHNLASQKDCSVLLLRHFSKGAKEKIIYRGMGSIDFAAAARSVMVCAEVDTDAGTDLIFKRRFAVLQIKNNVAPKGLAIEFELRLDEFGWIGGTERTVESLFPSLLGPHIQVSIEEARKFLLEVLADGPILAEDVRRQAKQLGLNSKVLVEAKLDLKVENEKLGTGWAWKLSE